MSDHMTPNAHMPLEPAAPIRVLLAEDDPTQRLVLEHTLREADYLVETTGDGVDALRLVVQGRVDILLTDLEMPGMDGQNLCRQIKQASLSQPLYILMLTARSEDEAASLDAGADDFVAKPWTRVVLLARLRNGARHIRDEREKQLLVMTDSLTGAYNRRQLTNQLPSELSRAARYSRPLTLIMADVDHFKQINDHYGHSVGDQVITGLSQRLRALIREVDWVVRYGGEEFAIVLPETALEKATEVAERFRRELEGTPISTTAGDLNVTASFGVAEFSATNDNADSLLNRADKAMYESKRGGRNRITVSRNT